MANGTIVVERHSGFQNRYRAYQVKIDGTVVANLRNGRSVEIAVTPGVHSVQLTVDWFWSSRIVDVRVYSTQQRTLICRPRRFYEAMFDLRINSTTYLNLEMLR